jgi:hypothetical protein
MCPWEHPQEETDLVSESMTTNDDGLHPTWDGLWDPRQDDGLAEDGATEDVSDLLAWVRLVILC